MTVDDVETAEEAAPLTTFGNGLFAIFAMYDYGALILKLLKAVEVGYAEAATIASFFSV